MKTLSALLSALLFLLAPGPQVVSVFAQTIARTAPVQINGIVPVAPIAQSGLSSGGLSPLNNTFTPGLSPAVLPTVPAAGLSAAGTAVKEHGFPTV
ncbi:MAG: hypothetical protein HY922_16830, partial [Elusimicrobia bacterium]|nr:hypothetical protein [Elusimicrobiota bacterium]